MSGLDGCDRELGIESDPYRLSYSGAPCRLVRQEPEFRLLPGEPAGSLPDYLKRKIVPLYTTVTFTVSVWSDVLKDAPLPTLNPIVA